MVKSNSQKGQTTVEYLLVLALVVGATFFFIRSDPFKFFVSGALTILFNNIQNTVQHGEFIPSAVTITESSPLHPVNRSKPVH